MDTTFRPVSKRRLAELEGYVSWVPILARAVFFLAAVGAPAFLLRAVHDRWMPSAVRHELWWIAPVAVFGAVLYRVSGRWTGGRAFRASVREDLSRGVAAVHRIVAVDAIEVEEEGDGGPAYFVRTAEGATLLFAGQYLDSYKRKGFPWTEFEILEAPRSRLFFGLVARGGRLTPSFRRPPFTWDEYKRFVSGIQTYAVLDVPFDTLKGPGG